MTNKDKVVAAFLVSLGLFSIVQAAQYVSSLSAQDKSALQYVAEAGSDATENPPNRVYPEA